MVATGSPSASVALRHLQLAQLGPAGVGASPVLVRPRLGALEALPADRAEALAVGAAEDLDRHREDQRVVGPAPDIEQAVGDVGACQLLVVGARLVDLAGVD